MDVLPAGRCLCLDDLSTSSSSAFVCCSAASTPSRATSRDVTSCSRCPAPPPSGTWNLVFVFIPTPAPGPLKQLVSSLVRREACILAAVRSWCSIASRLVEVPTEFPAAGAWSPFLRRSRVSLSRPSTCKAIRLPAVSTATPQEPPYWATNLNKETNLKQIHQKDAIFCNQGTFTSIWNQYFTNPEWYQDTWVNRDYDSIMWSTNGGKKKKSLVSAANIINFFHLMWWSN